MKNTTMMLLILFSSCLHLHASSNPEKKNHYVDTREELVVHKNGVNPVVKRGGGGAHGGGGGGHSGGGGGHGGGAGGDAEILIPVYAAAGAHRSSRNQHGRNNSGHKSTALPQLVSAISPLALLLTYCC